MYTDQEEFGSLEEVGIQVEMSGSHIAVAVAGHTKVDKMQLVGQSMLVVGDMAVSKIL